MDEPAPENGAPRWRPTVPTVVVVVSVLVALVAVSGLLVLLFRETVGPGQVLRDFSRRLEARDCPGSYDLLDGLVQRRLDQEDWCEAVPRLRERLTPGFDIDRVVLEEDVARIVLEGDGRPPATWVLRRFDRSWRVLGAAGPVEFPVDVAELLSEAGG